MTATAETAALSDNSTGSSKVLQEWHEKLYHIHYTYVLATLDKHWIKYPESDKKFARQQSHCPECTGSKLQKAKIPKASRSHDSNEPRRYHLRRLDGFLNEADKLRGGAVGAFMIHDGYTSVQCQIQRCVSGILRGVSTGDETQSRQ